MAKSNEQKEQKLTPTKNSFKLMGKVVWLGKDGAYKEDTITKGDNAGNEYRSLRFGVQTSPTNIVPVEIFGMETKEVRAWHSKERVVEKFPWEDRFDLASGWVIMDTNISLTRDAKKKLVREHFTNFDAVEKLHDELNDGDSVFVSGEIQFQSYEKDGETVNTTKYIIKSVSRLQNEIDFEDEKFEETASFEMEIIVNGVDYDKETKNAYVSVYTIQFGDKWSTGTLVVHGETHPKLTESFRKRLKPMDFIKVYGNCVNASDVVEVEDEGDDWGSEKPKGYNNNTARSTTRELRVTGVEASTHEAKKYKVEDFVTVTKESSDNPFAKKATDKDKDKKNSKNKDQEFGGSDDDDDDSIPF